MKIELLKQKQFRNPRISPDENLSSTEFHYRIQRFKGNEGSDKPRKRRFAGPFGSFQLPLLEFRRQFTSSGLRRRLNSDSWRCTSVMSAGIVVDRFAGVCRPNIRIVELRYGAQSHLLKLSRRKTGGIRVVAESLAFGRYGG